MWQLRFAQLVLKAGLESEVPAALGDTRVSQCAVPAPGTWWHWWQAPFCSLTTRCSKKIMEHLVRIRIRRRGKLGQLQEKSDSLYFHSLSQTLLAPAFPVLMDLPEFKYPAWFLVFQLCSTPTLSQRQSNPHLWVLWRSSLFGLTETLSPSVETEESGGERNQIQPC